jgi:hypothetical protein
MPMQGARMPHLDLTDEWIPELLALFAIITEQSKFTPSAVSLREQRAREQADRTIKAFSERFTEKDFYPQDDEWLVFALLPQLPEWPADLALRLINGREVIATWTKGSDGSVIKGNINLEQMNNGNYAALYGVPQSINDLDTLFQLILPLLPASSQLGSGGDFPGSETTAGRIVTLRKQIAALVKAKSAQVFDALLADFAEIKQDSDDRYPNPFLPFWQVQPTDRSPVLNRLLALNPAINPERFEALLEQVPLSDTQSAAFLEDGELPEPFIEALEQSVEEWSKDKGLDGVFHTRTYSPDADVLAQEFGETLLKDFGYELIITEPWQTAYEPGSSNKKTIVVKHNGYGLYWIPGGYNGEVDSSGSDTDSFYRAIGSVLQPGERARLGMQSETDVEGLRTTLGNVAKAANGGWFDPQEHIEVKHDLLPEWLKDASMADKLLWNQYWEDYRQALVEAQSPDLPDIKQYGSPEHLRSYAKREIEQRLRADLGLTISPDDITVVTTESTWTGNQEPPPGFEYGVQPVGEGEFEYVETRRSLTQLCLENLRLEDSEFWLTAQFFNSNNRPLTALSRNYVHGLVRDLNVGDSYAQFLRQRLLTSDFGQWTRERYAQVMATQMRLDAVEAKMAGDFHPDRADRGYKWVRAVLDHPLDDGNRPLVEKHQIQVQTLTLRHVSPFGPLRSWEAPLEGVLMIAPESRLSVPGMVIYTPSAPDGVRFREFSSREEMESGLLGNTNLWGYFESRAPVGFKTNVREGLINAANGGLYASEQPPITADLYFTHYKTEVERVITQIDAQTTTTSEANWSTAWSIASALAELALEFAPFKVALPIAAARSLYAIRQGAVALGKGDATAGVHFTQAILLIADGLPGVRRSKTKTLVSPKIEPSYALKTAPTELKLRTDGRFNGVYEKVDADGRSSFYAQDAGNTFAIRYDSSDARWRVINGLNPRSYYQMPISFDGANGWSHAPVLRGAGKGEKKAIKVQKAEETKKAAEAEAAKKAQQEKKPKGDRSEPESGPSTPKGETSAIGRPTVDLDGLLADTNFMSTALARTGTTEAQFTKSVNRAVEMFNGRAKGSPHSSFQGLFSLDLLGLGVKGSTGRGKWRLMFGADEKGVRKVVGIGDHKTVYRRAGATNQPDS